MRLEFTFKSRGNPGPALLRVIWSGEWSSCEGPSCNYRYISRRGAMPFPPHEVTEGRGCVRTLSESSLETEPLPSPWTSSLQYHESNFLLFISQLAYGFLLQQLEKDPEAPTSAAAVSLTPLRGLRLTGKPRVYAHRRPKRHPAHGSESQASHFPKLPFPNPITFCASALPGQMQPGPG